MIRLALEDENKERVTRYFSEDTSRLLSAKNTYVELTLRINIASGIRLMVVLASVGFNLPV